MIRHTVVSSLRHPRGSQQEHDVLRDARVLAGPDAHAGYDVHPTDDLSGDDRWGRGAACRWRGLPIRDLA